MSGLKGPLLFSENRCRAAYAVSISRFSGISVSSAIIASTG
jgi:hypothetical protein